MKKDIRFFKLTDGSLNVGTLDEMTQMFTDCRQVQFQPHPKLQGMVVPVLVNYLPNEYLQGKFSNTIKIDISREKTIFDIPLVSICDKIENTFLDMYQRATSNIVVPSKKNVLDINAKGKKITS